MIPNEPIRWILCFQRTTPYWWIDILNGKYKHVAAFGNVPGTRTWLFYDIRLDGTHIASASGDDARVMMTAYARDADLVGMPVQENPRGGFRFGLYCVPAIASLLGLGCVAALPTGFYRWCIRHGGEVIDGKNSEVRAVAA